MSRSPDRSGNSERVGELVSIFLRGKVWWANFQHEGRQQRKSLGTRNKKEARKRAAKLEASIDDGSFSSQRKASTIDDTISEYLKYLETEGRAPRTMSKYREVFECVLPICNELSVTTVDQIDLRFIDEFRHRLVKRENSEKTIYNKTMIIRQLVNFAISRKHVAADPLAGLKLKKPKKRPQPCWSAEEVSVILAQCDDPQLSILTTLAETGTRIGELKHLTRDDLDFKKNLIHIQPKEGWKPKTGDCRSVPMTDRVRKILRARLTESKSDKWVFTALPSKKYPNGDQQFSERRLLEYLQRRLPKLGLRGHLHTFRHSFISHAISSGIPPGVLREIVGHVDDEILEHYTHIADDRKQLAIQQFAESLPELGSVDKDEQPDSSEVEEEENDVSE